MPRREAHSRQTSSPDEGANTDEINGDPCVMCGQPIGDQEASRMHFATNPSDRTGRAHAKCVHERAIVGRVMGER